MAVIAIVFGLGFPVLFYILNLTTEVRGDGIYYRFFPFHLSFRRIAFAELAKCEVRDYSPLKDYGGWGIRHGSKGKAYNVSGNRGVQLEMKSGDNLLFGSQRPEEFAEAIEVAMGNQN